MTLNSRSRSPIFELVRENPKKHPWSKLGSTALNIYQVIALSRGHFFVDEKMPVTLGSRSRSSTFELVQGIVEVHPWFELGVTASNIHRVIALSEIISATDRPTDRASERASERAIF